VRTTYVAPEYPDSATRERVRGIVILQLVIDSEGVVRTTRVLRSVAPLDDAAVDAVCQWRFAPARLKGRAVAVRMAVTVTFR
jgi:protein TonB